ncbi:glycosyltransferase, partial [uncultured Gemmiger sp.]|uniref:glycosyltransferase n=1 Tax=uncultured Gemmiger sp. TaxID=1623490 RepID=UPI0025F60496
MAKETENRPADVAAQDSVGGMARRLLNPAHLRDLARRSAATFREQGAEQLWRDVTFRVGLAFHHDSWRHRADIPLRRELKAQRAARLQGPLVSVVVPVYNTPETFFRQMVKSVQRQTYSNWQLVLVDASDDAHPVPGRLAQKLAEKDSRVVYRKVENGGIAANTTAGFALASGDYLALLDHDDLLYPNALFECVQTIQTTGADLVYSDEIVLSADLKQLGGYHFKPDFAPDYLRGCN